VSAPSEQSEPSETGAGPRLRMRGVEKSFGPVRALQGVDLVVGEGEVHALLGENGAGKSTLMKVLSGAYQADAGELTLDGEAYAPRGPQQARARGVAMIYQELALAVDLTVEENIVLGAEPRRRGAVDRAARRALAERALSRLGDGAPAPDARVAELGPGARQLVEIARALASDARVLVFDEPTSSLSRRDAEHLFEVVARLRSEGASVIWIGHFLEEIQRVADRWTVLRDGATVGTGDVADTDPSTWVTLMAGRAVEEFFPPRTPAVGDVLLELDELAGSPAPEAASLSLRRGEILGLAGLVGAGRTELLRALFGLDAVESGRVRLAQADLAPADPRRRIDQGFGLASEDRKAEGLALDRSIAFNLTLSRPVASRGVLRRGDERAAVARWVESLGVRCRDGVQAIGELSGGNQQKVALARLLHQDAEVLLLDEPTRGVDVGAKVEIYRLLGELAAQGKALLVVSSYFPELLGVCDRIAVMHRGRLGPARPAAEWTETTLLDAAARGEGDAA